MLTVLLTVVLIIVYPKGWRKYTFVMRGSRAVIDTETMVFLADCSVTSCLLKQNHAHLVKRQVTDKSLRGYKSLGKHPSFKLILYNFLMSEKKNSSSDLPLYFQHFQHVLLYSHNASLIILISGKSCENLMILSVILIREKNWNCCKKGRLGTFSSWHDQFLLRILAHISF